VKADEKNGERDQLVQIAPAPPTVPAMELSAARTRLAAAGPRFWRSLDELSAQPGFDEMLHGEFPRQTGAITLDEVSRRNFLKLMSGSLALAGLSGCVVMPREPIIPYVRQPEELVPGRALHFASAMPFPGGARPVLVTSHQGRPTKIEGNPDHPGGQPGADAYMQAAVLELYDPDRSQVITQLGQVRPWSVFVTAMRTLSLAQRAIGGAGLRLLTPPVNSPTLQAQMEELLKLYPQARWHQWEPLHQENSRAGAVLAFGRPVDVHYRMAEADVIVSLDADFLSPGHATFLRDARAFAARRRVEHERGMNRLYAVESSPSTTGFKADHRLSLRASEIESFARALARRLGVEAGGGNEPGHERWLAALAADLGKHRGASLVVAGEYQPPAVHALAHALNEALGNAGRTVFYTAPVAPPPAEGASLGDLVAEMRQGTVQVLVMLGGNPVYDAPADSGFAEALNRVGTRVHVGLYQNETAQLSQWHVPEAHWLEAWSDARAADGTASVVQPLIAPLYSGRTAHEVLALFGDKPDAKPYDLVREYWQTRHRGDFERFWRRALHDGFIPQTAEPALALRARTSGLPAPSGAAGREGLELNFRRDPAVFDGRFANNAWLQETPRPLSKLTWENPVWISPAMAEFYSLRNGDVAEVSAGGRALEAPVWIQPGHPDGSLTLFLGYGRERAGRVGNGVGTNAYRLRTAAAPWFLRGASLRPAGRRVPLAVTQEHQRMEGRDPVRAGTLEEWKQNPAYARERVPAPAPGTSLYPPWEYKGYSWGMAIDLNSCVGCSACMVACQAENNIPVVGKEEVARGHEMNWLRVDVYYEGDAQHPGAYFQPVPCMHCDNAPCEPVCPVAATVHSHEGLNEQVYNRCVGTRYCANNCPYKVRRFNFFQYQDWDSPLLKLLRNPNVSVRSRGVMEKCTYCVQRINAARIQTEVEGRRIRDGEVQTACQQACPAGAIVFGDINDPHSRVAALKGLPRNYGLLAELGTRPRTSYLAAVRNPNPELEGEA
jgi:MoCo/4Fe-4S cofactor protein with predicted Tat translocation signal